MKLLIIYPHWPPSNLAGVHRARLTANALIKLGHKVSVLTVHEKFYEEALDFDFVKTVHPDIEIIRVAARKVTKPRLIGDIGLRAYFQIREKALELLQTDAFDFVWIPIPSFYMALLGPYLKKKTGIKYGIDYIDPWVRDITGRANFRAKLSNLLATYLEPKALETVDVVSGVAEEYYLPALRRNFKKADCPLEVAFPYGYDPIDYEQQIEAELPWQKDEQPIVYAGAFLPNSHLFLKSLFALLQKHKDDFIKQKIKFYFIGTGNYIQKSIATYAKEFGLKDLVVEDRKRRPYLEILHYLKSASGILVLGSTEAHYTASKVFQAILSQKPVLSVFHEESSAAELLSQTANSPFLQTWQNQSEVELSQALKNKLVAFVAHLNFRVKVPEIMIEFQTIHGAKKLVEKIRQLDL